MQETCDALVVGAGIVGAATAFRLSERGLRVHVIEAANAPATGSTGRSAAGVRVQFASDLNVRLSLAGIEEYREFQDRYGLPSGYRPQGYLFLVPQPLWEAHADGIRVQRSAGAPVQELTAEEAQTIVPFDATGIHAATYGPIDGVVDPHALTSGYLKMARDRGTTLHLEHPMTAARYGAGTWRIDTPRATFEAPIVVNAAGAWAGEVARMASLDLPIVPVRRMVFTTGPLSTPHAYPLTIDMASGVYLRSEGERLLFGRSNPDEPAGFTEGMDWPWLEATLEPGLSRFPFLETAGLDRHASWWGYYEMTPDHDAILGRHPGAEGWIDAAGFSGHGVQHAAMVARLMAEEVVDGAAHSLDLTPLRHARFHADARDRRAETHIV